MLIQQSTTPTALGTQLVYELHRSRYIPEFSTKIAKYMIDALRECSYTSLVLGLMDNCCILSARQEERVFKSSIPGNEVISPPTKVSYITKINQEQYFSL